MFGLLRFPWNRLNDRNCIVEIIQLLIVPIVVMTEKVK